MPVDCNYSKMPGHTYKAFPNGMTTSANKLTKLERIGCGGFGQVFKATHVDWGIVALKKLPQEFIQENKAVKQMSREVEILQTLRHRNIIAICGVVFEVENYGIVLEYMKHGSLDNFLSEFSVPLPYKVQLAFDVVLGMNYLHTQEKPIIHGDLKIQNVLVADGYLAKISDFGLSSWKVMSKTSSRSTNDCQGTVTHVPPERWQNINLARDQLEDVYAFGILLWEIFTEEAPFAAAPPNMISTAVRSGQRPDTSLLPKDLPSTIRSLIETSWDQVPTKRKPFREIKEILERYITEETKNITAARAELQRQESSSSETSLECDGSSLVQSTSEPSCATRASVDTNPALPIARNETGNPETTDFKNIRIDLKQEAKADESNTAAAASSLCAQSSASVTSRVETGKSTSSYERVGGEGGISPRAVAETSLCSAEDVKNLRLHLQTDLNIRPVQESNGRSVQADVTLSHPLLSSGVLQLRSDRADNRSETLAKNVTEPKSLEDAVYPVATNTDAAAAAGRLGDESDAQLQLSLHGDRPSHYVGGDVNLRSSSASVTSSHSTSEAVQSSRMLPQPLVSDRQHQRLSHSQSVPEADAILSPDAQRTAVQQQPALFPKGNEQSHVSAGIRAEQEHSPNWNIGTSGSDNNLDISQGFYPKGGGSFQKHVHPDNDQPFFAQPLSAHLLQPSGPSLPQWQPMPTGSTTGFAVNQSGATSLPAPRCQPLPTSKAGASWNALNRDSRSAAEAKPKSQEYSTITCKKDGQEVTIIHSAGSGIQIGNNNTMIISERSSSKTKPGSGLSSAPSSSSVFSPAAAAGGTKAPPMKKLVVPDKLVTQDVMLMVAEKIGTDWKQLARHLNLLDSDIDSLFADNFHLGTVEVAYQMLRDWRERRGQEAKMQTLARALVAAKRPDIAQNLASKSSDNSET